MKNKNGKKIIAGVLALAVAVIGFGTPQQVKAAENEVVKYEIVAFDTFSSAISGHTAPELEGYLFGGWYKYDETNKTGEVIKEASEVSSGDTIAAKYVRADMSGIACQLNLTESTNSRDMRFVSAVHSTNYSAVGFNVYGRKLDEGTGKYKEWLMYRYGSDRQAQSTKVYSGLRVYSSETEYTVKSPVDIFGTDAEGFKFTTMLLKNIPSTDYDTIISIRPYWITMDGTYVEGMGEFDRVNDNADKIVNVSVNLKQASAIAAGLLQVKYDTSNFKYQNADYGRVFEEMEIAEPEAGTIKCVGNMSTSNSANPNDVYVNLRFKKTDSNTLKAGEAVFEVTISDNNFCNINEEYVNVTTSNVRY